MECFALEFDGCDYWEDGFAIELQAPSGARHIKAFYAADLPKISPEKDPIMDLGLLPAPTPLDQWQELRLGPVDAVIFASERVWIITKVSARLMTGLFTGSTSLKQLGGPLSIADMAGKLPR